jgi:hypothetical protein
MKPIRLWAALIAAASVFAEVLPSQNCTHMTVNAVGGSLKPMGVQPCTFGLSVTIHGLTLRLGHCPLWILATPAHREPVREPGCGTDVVVAARLPLENYPVKCMNVDLLLFEFGYCTAQAPFVIGIVNDWQTQPCR